MAAAVVVKTVFASTDSPAILDDIIINVSISAVRSQTSFYLLKRLAIRCQVPMAAAVGAETVFVSTDSPVIVDEIADQLKRVGSNLRLAFEVRTLIQIKQMIRLRVGWLWEGCRESRRCLRDTYPESYISPSILVNDD